MKKMYFYNDLKQIAVILLLGVFAFNIFGYKIYFDIAEQNTTTKAEQQIAQEAYQQSDLVTYKFPATQLPYYTNDKNYDVANGEVVVAGTVMTYVKKRIYNDSIEYVCLPNKAKTQIRSAREEFFKLVNDYQAKNTTEQGKTNKNVKPFVYDGIGFDTSSEKSLSFNVINSIANGFYSASIICSPSHIEVPPPDDVV